MAEQQPASQNSSNDLQFDKAETGDVAAPGPVTCAVCQMPIRDMYYAVNDKVICANCSQQVMASQTGGSKTGRLLKATLFGLAAGLVGALIWFAVRRFTGYEVGLIAVLVGLMVGGAVRKGSGGRGGVGYQLLAVALTYGSICANYMPDVAEELWQKFKEEESAQVTPATQPAGTEAAATTAPTAAETPANSNAPVADEEEPSGIKIAVGLVLLILLIFFVSLIAPFLAGAANLIGLLIIGFALWEAWKMNKRQALAIHGPYALGQPAPGTAGM